MHAKMEIVPQLVFCKGRYIGDESSEDAFAGAIRQSRGAIRQGSAPTNRRRIFNAFSYRGQTRSV